MARDIDKSSIRVCFLVTDDEKRALDQHRMKLRVTLSEMIRQRIRDYLVSPKERALTNKKKSSQKTND